MLNPRSPPSATTAADTLSSLGDGNGYPSKRARLNSPGPAKAVSPKHEDEEDEEEELTLEVAAVTALGGGGGGKASHSSNFRNVSACNRCRLRKNRCDQRLPSCASCEKARVKCVGYDSITKREIPRSYVFYLESRVGYLERLLQDNGISFVPADVLDHSSRPGADPVHTPNDDGRLVANPADSSVIAPQQSPQEVAWNKRQDDSEKLDKLVSNIGNASVQGASDSRYLGSTSGISFARLVFAAVKSSVSGSNSDKSGVKPSRPPIPGKAAVGGGTSMRDSFFGLQTKPNIKQAPFPNKDIGMRLVELYFEHANPQIPILHRGEFMKMFELAYADGAARVRTPRELYLLNIVFAIGAGVFLGDSDKGRGVKENNKDDKRRSKPGKQCQPEEYHASAVVHLESCLSSPASVERADGFGGGLEELQLVLLLAGFALLRPVAPGLWYIIGVAVRLAVDLGLHYEDGKDIQTGLEETRGATNSQDADLARMHRERTTRERGRREWVRDFRRRLWWCTYSFDRLVSTCVGRPFGITDQVVTTEFPSLLDDKHITLSGFLRPIGVDAEPSCKLIAYHYFRLRLLQSEILQVLQHQQAQQARAGGANQRNPYMHTALPSPFMSKFDGFRSWRMDIDKRLWDWKSSAPTKKQTGVAFSVEFLELNYWQCVIMLYRQSLSVPPLFEGEFDTSEEVESPRLHNVELRGDEERVFLKVAEAGQRVLRLYRQLHRVHLVSYTFLATHHLFMAGISFLYAIWHSPVVRSRLTMDEVDFTILAATSVLGDLVEKCPPAEACRDAFDRMSKATVQMCMSTTGFGSSGRGLNSRREEKEGSHTTDDYFDSSNESRLNSSSKRQKPTFDTGFNDLLGSPTNSSPPAMSAPRNFTTSHHTTSPSAVKDFAVPAAPVRQNMNQSLSPSDYAYSPPLSSLDASAIDPSLVPSPAQGRAFNQAVQATYQLNPYQELQFNAPGMDFLQGNGWDLASGDDRNNGSWTGDLGMGLSWEGLDGTGHDFSEGGNGGLDLFDGFFFGGTGGN